jgi:dsDNA-specific endonuclease/ATPase MutS2
LYASERTKREIGFTDVLSKLRPLTPLGKKRAADIRAFLPGEETSLESEFDNLQRICEMLVSHKTAAARIAEEFGEIKDISYSVTRSAGDILSTVELFEIKALLLRMETLTAICEDIGQCLPACFVPEDVSGLLNALDPDGGRMPVFYIYDVFSERLAELRKQKKEKERLIGAERRRLADETLASSGIALTPRYDTSIARSDETAMRAARNAPYLRAAGEDLFSVRFTLAAGDEELALTAETDALLPEIEAEEESVRKRLTDAVANEAKRILRNCERIGGLDFLMAKASHALENNCVRPVISKSHVLRIEEGRHLPTERALREKGLSYKPVSIELAEGVSCVTGANMGGKTVLMKLAGLVAAMAGHGMFVPCASATLGLSSSVGILIGDEQDAGRGLSSFGSEMDGLNVMLSESGKRALLLIDEIAGATNPLEGRALTKGLIAYLSDKPYITLITTHFDRVSDGSNIVNYQIRGLSGADLGELTAALTDAGSDERLKAIATLMDYRPERVSGERETPKDALRIAEILGIDKGILDLARGFTDEQKPSRPERNQNEQTES